jgi:SAM-dependent methyltransferase
MRVSLSHFDEIANEYDASLPPHVVEHYLRKRTAFVVEHCPPGAGLDVGCGTGALADRLSAAGYEMTGIDPSTGMLEVLSRRAPHVRALEGSGSSLPFAADTFDLVVTVAVMHHIATERAVKQALTEMVRVAKPNGRIVVWDHNPRNPYWKSLMARVPQDTGEERLIPEHEILAGLHAGGGRILLSAQLGFMPDFIPSPALRAMAGAEKLLEQVPLLRRVAAHNVILATK